MKSFQSCNSPGPDQVHPKVLYELSDIIDKPLCTIFNSSFKTGTVPEGWIIGQITALFKKGSKNSASNYRPVSLRDRSFNLKGGRGLWFFAKREFFFQNLTLGYMTKTESDFFSNIGNQNILLEKNITPLLQVKWSFP